MDFHLKWAVINIVERGSLLWWTYSELISVSPEFQLMVWLVPLTVFTCSRQLFSILKSFKNTPYTTCITQHLKSQISPSAAEGCVRYSCDFSLKCSKQIGWRPVQGVACFSPKVAGIADPDRDQAIEDRWIFKTWTLLTKCENWQRIRDIWHAFHLGLPTVPYNTD